MSTFPFLGPVSSGTLRPEDLIGPFMDLLDDVLNWRATSGLDSPQDTDEVAHGHEVLGNVECLMSATGYFDDAEGVLWDLELITNALDILAPPYTYFGSHEGDSACFGYWPAWEALDGYGSDLPHGDKLPNAPAPHTEPYFLVVSDYGNATLYEWTGHKWAKVWVIV